MACFHYFFRIIACNDQKKVQNKNDQQVFNLQLKKIIRILKAFQVDCQLKFLATLNITNTA